MTSPADGKDNIDTPISRTRQKNKGIQGAV